MATEVGGNLINDSVVFGYDTGYGVSDNTTATRFYPGKPISNSINGGADRANAVINPSLGSHGASVTTEIISYGNRKNVFRIYSTNASGYYMVNQQSSIINTSGNVYTYSFDYKKIKGTNSSFSPSAIYKNGYKTPDSGSAATSLTDTIVDLEDGWKRLTRTYTSTYSGYNLYRTNLNTDNTLDFEYLFDNFMVNEGVPVPFVDSTRSNTASLIDLRRTKDIDVSNTSFDSSGQMNFDASDDQIVVDVDSIVRNADTITIEGIVNASVNAGAPWGILTDHTVAGDKDGFWWHYNIGGYTYFRVEDATAGEQGTTFPGSVPFVSDVNQHVVTVVGLNHVSVYVNGELEQSYTPNFRWNRIDSSKTAYLHIGRTFPNYYLAGEVPVFKMHNRKLTASEIKQSYQSYKKRFNL